MQYDVTARSPCVRSTLTGHGIISGHTADERSLSYNKMVRKRSLNLPRNNIASVVIKMKYLEKRRDIHKGFRKKNLYRCDHLF